MPFIFVTAWYPTHKATEVAKRYFEQLKKYPEDPSLGETRVQAAVNIGKRGVKVKNISKVNEGKLEESLTYTRNAMSMYNDIEGFEYSIVVWSEVTEALATIGMKLP
ncbi:MAG: hypothetical protein ACFFAH_02460 [Promethearchaeota archaeon]